MPFHLTIHSTNERDIQSPRGTGVLEREEKDARVRGEEGQFSMSGAGGMLGHYMAGTE